MTAGAPRRAAASAGIFDKFCFFIQITPYHSRQMVCANQKNSGQGVNGCDAKSNSSFSRFSYGSDAFCRLRMLVAYLRLVD